MNVIKKPEGSLFLSSKVAKRTFLVFILCAILPLVTISAISLLYVGNQLEGEAKLRLQQQCKNKGFLIYERLTTLENELKSVSRDYLKGRLERLERRPYDPIDREGSGWRRLFLHMPDGTIVPIVNHVDNLPQIQSAALGRPNNDRTHIQLIHNDDISPVILLSRQLDPQMPVKGTIVGEVEPLYLWGIGITGALPPEIDLSVILGRKKILISSIPDYLISAEFIEAHERDVFSGNFESSRDGLTYINSYWSLFLNHRFSSPDWTILFSQSKSSIMTPVTKFKFIFFLLVLLTFWVILLLSFRSIRRRTVPVEKLKAGAVKIADGEFGHQIDVTSGDEYEELAQAFNEMSARIKQTQAMMMQAAKMSTFGQMGAGIVHEIGQPLGAISGFAELLQKGVSPEKQQHFLDVICSETARLRDIIAKFRTFSRVSNDVFELVSLNDILRKTQSLMDHQLKINFVELDMQLAEDLPAIDGDRNGLQQIFLNLLNNAVDALEDKPQGERKVRIGVGVENDRVKVDIEDNGCGIPKDIQQSIFDPFFTTKGEDKGTGLGLAIMGTLLHKHNATIELTSEVGRGTCFTLSFPVARPGKGA